MPPGMRRHPVRCARFARLRDVEARPAAKADAIGSDGSASADSTAARSCAASSNRPIAAASRPTAWSAPTAMFGDVQPLRLLMASRYCRVASSGLPSADSRFPRKVSARISSNAVAESRAICQRFFGECAGAFEFAELHQLLAEIQARAADEPVGRAGGPQLFQTFLRGARPRSTWSSSKVEAMSACCMMKPPIMSLTTESGGSEPLGSERSGCFGIVLHSSPPLRRRETLRSPHGGAGPRLGRARAPRRLPHALSDSRLEPERQNATAVKAYRKELRVTESASERQALGRKCARRLQIESHHREFRGIARQRTRAGSSSPPGRARTRARKSRAFGVKHHGAPVHAEIRRQSSARRRLLR